MVGIVDDHDVGKITGSRADGELLFEVREGDILGYDFNLVLGGIEVLADPGQGFLMLDGFPIVPDCHSLLLGEDP